MSPVGSGYLRPFPLGTPPSATFLNYTSGIGITNAGALTLGAFGLDGLGLRNFGGSAHYVVDVLGYFSTSAAVQDRAQSIVAGAGFACAATSARVLCWGTNGSGQRGDGIGVTVFPADPALRQVPGISSLVQVAAGGHAGVGAHMCVLRAIGQMACTGANAAGQLGVGDTSARTAPTAVPGLAGVVQISANDRHTCVLISDGTVRCWGRNAEGQLGTGDATDRSSPTAVPGLTDAVQVTTGEAHSCALRRDGTVRCWGRNAQGQLGDGSKTERRSPVVVLGPRGVPPLEGVLQISAGGSVTCAAMVDGTARCWGSSTQTGFIGTHVVARPDVVGTGTTPLSGVTRVTSGSFHSCALLADGSARCWGNNNNGELGNGATSGLFQKPVAVVGLGPSAPVAQLSAGRDFTCASLVDGTARCWGAGGSGQLGTGSLVASSSPATVLSIP